MTAAQEHIRLRRILQENFKNGSNLLFAVSGGGSGAWNLALWTRCGGPSTKNGVTTSSSSPTPGRVSGENANSKGHTHRVHSSTIHNSQDMEATRVSIDRGMDKEDVAHVYTKEYYSAIKKNELMPSAATWRDLEVVILSEVSQRKTNII